MMKRFILLCLIALLLPIAGCVSSDESGQEYPSTKQESTQPTTSSAPEQPSLIQEDGSTLATRISPPSGYQRTEAATDSLTLFLREMPLKPSGSPVLLYDGRRKGNQSAHVAVFDLDVGDEDLQQCADAVMRVYSEYFWATGQQDRIAFHLTNGFLMDYPSYRAGNRLKINGNTTSWVKSAGYDDSYETFRQYFRLVMSYAGTLSLDKESRSVELADIRPGDLFIRGGSPGHCVLVVDLAKNAQGESAFLLAQSYMPAQEFHLLKNPAHEADPWYYSSELTYPLSTPEYSFGQGSLKRWGDF